MLLRTIVSPSRGNPKRCQWPFIFIDPTEMMPAPPSLPLQINIKKKHCRSLEILRPPGQVVYNPGHNPSLDHKLAQSSCPAVIVIAVLRASLRACQLRYKARASFIPNHAYPRGTQLILQSSRSFFFLLSGSVIRLSHPRDGICTRSIHAISGSTTYIRVVTIHHSIRDQHDCCQSISSIPGHPASQTDSQILAAIGPVVPNVHHGKGGSIYFILAAATTTTRLCMRRVKTTFALQQLSK